MLAWEGGQGVWQITYHCIPSQSFTEKTQSETDPDKKAMLQGVMVWHCLQVRGDLYEGVLFDVGESHVCPGGGKEELCRWSYRWYSGQ